MTDTLVTGHAPERRIPADPVEIPGVWVTSADRRKARGLGLLAAVVFGLACLLGAALDARQLLRSYLVAYLVFWSLSLGCLGLLLLGHVAQGAWTVVLRRTFEAGARTISPLALLFVPILAGAHMLYPWTAPWAAEDPAVRAKAVYLNLPAFALRAVVYFAVWIVTARRLSRMTAAQEAAADPHLPRRLRKASAVGLVAYGLTVTLAAVDWMMSLDPRWWSTLYGLLVISGQAVSALSLAVVTAWLVGRRKGRAPFGPGHFHDFGKMLLALVMVWAYFNFSQYLIIWSGNLPEEISFYADRASGVAHWESFALAVFHFAVPFLALLGRDLKRSPSRLAWVSGLLLFMHVVDVHWLVAPAFHGATVHWLDFAALGAVGGIWVVLFTRELGRRPLVPLGEPTLREALSNG